MRVVFDLDGVLRDLISALNERYGIPFPTEWHWSYNGKSIFEWVSLDPTILEDAPATELVSVVKRHFFHPEIWSNQPESWKPYTVRWLNKHFDNYTLRFLSGKEKEGESHGERRYIFGRGLSTF